jgi:hypothetical protein
MRQIKVLTLALFACLAVGAVATAVAAAEKPEFSPAEKNTFTTSGEKLSFEQKGGIGAITATSSEGSGAVESAKEGKFDELFLKVEGPFTGLCTGLDDTVKGSVLAKGTFKIGYLDAAKTKVGVALKLKPEVHFECQFIVTLITVRGTVICELTPINVDTTQFLILCKQEKGVNQFVEILNATNTAFEKGILESELNGGAFAQSGQSIHAKLTTTKLATIVA